MCIQASPENRELSALGNAATGVVFPIFIIAQAFARCFGDGGAAYLNICPGKMDTKNATKAIGTGIVVTFVSLLVWTAIFFPLKIQHSALFGASENSIGFRTKASACREKISDKRYNKGVNKQEDQLQAPSQTAKRKMMLASANLIPVDGSSRPAV